MKLGELSVQRDIALVLVGDDVEQHELIHLFEGVLYADGMYPIIIRNEKSTQEIEAMIERLHITQLFAIGNSNMRDGTSNVCHIALEEIENMLTTCSYENLQAMQIKSRLQRYETLSI